MKIYAIIFTAFLSGCASMVLHIPPKPKQSETGNLYVARQSTLSFGARMYYIGINGKPFVGLKGHEYSVIKLDPGKYSIGVACSKTILSSKADSNPGSWEEETINVEIKANTDFVALFGPSGFDCVKYQGEVSTTLLRVRNFKRISIGSESDKIMKFTAPIIANFDKNRA